MRAMQVAVLLTIMMSAQTAMAVRVPGLYQAEVPVPDQSEISRKQAIPAALRAVLVKLTGERHVAGRTAVVPVLRLAHEYVQQFRYREVDIATADTAVAPQRQLRLQVVFDEAALNRDLRDLGITVWGRERPTTLLWLVIEDDEGRHWLSADRFPLAVSTVYERAAERGITLVLPLLDLEDAASLNVSDIWAGFEVPVRNASSRYQTDMVLTATVSSPVPGIWEGKWHLLREQGALHWGTEADLQELVLDEGVHGLADRIAEQFVRPIVAGTPEIITLEVVDISELRSYARVLDYLKSLSTVSNVQVLGAEAGRVGFRLTVHGGDQALRQAISLGRVLEPVATQGSYRLLP